MSGKHLLNWFSVVVLISLSGCMLAPGTYMSDATKSIQVESARAQDLPVGVLIPITPDVINSQRLKLDVPIKTKIQHLLGEPGPYTIGAGDILNVVVWDHPDLALPAAGAVASSNEPGAPASLGNGYNVSSNGTIQFPYIGILRVIGLTEDKLQELLTNKLSKFLKNPQITVRIQTYRSGRVYMEGQILRPGLQTLNDLPLTLPEALGRAGGTSSAADLSRITIIRNGISTEIDMPTLVDAGINPSGILLKSGDLVRIPSLTDSKVYVLGEVFRPTALLMRSGRLTLNEALGEGGGVSSYSGDPKQIYILRSDDGLNPQIFHLNASTPTAYALAEGFQLKPRDVVYVDPVPLVRWNRVISLLLPSSNAIVNWSSLSNVIK